MLLQFSVNYYFLTSLKYFLEPVLTNILFFNIDFLSIKQNSIVGNHVFYIMLFILISFIFKLALFPLHSWAAEVYSVLSFRLLFVFIILLKSVFFIKFIHIFVYAFNIYTGSIIFFLKSILLFITFGSIFIGSVTVLFEDKLRKILALSSTNNLGFIFVGIFCYTDVINNCLLLNVVLGL